MTFQNTSANYLISAWRKSILQQLHEREKQETKPFENLIQHCNKFFESSDAFRADYLNLFFKCNQFNFGAPDNQVANDQRRNYRFICEKCPAIEKINDEQMFEIKNQQNLLKKEYDALKHEYDIKTKEHLALDQEHKKLINQIKNNNAKDAYLLNSIGEKIVRQKEQLRRKELEMAADSIKIISVDDKQDTFKSNSSAFVLARIPDHWLFTQEVHDGEVNALKWVTGIQKFRNQAVLATGGGDRKVKLWMISLNSCSLLEPELTNSNAAITSIDFESEFLLASSSDSASRLWTVSNSRLNRTFTGHSSKVTAAKFLGTSSKSVSGSHDRTVKIWDIDKHVCISSISTGSICNDLATRPGHEAEIISGHFDKTIKFFDTRVDLNAYDTIQLRGRITSLDISQNDRSLLSCDRDDTLNLFDLRNVSKAMLSFRADGFKVGCDWTRAIISPDSEYVAAGSSDGSIFIWNINNGKLEKELKGGHTSNVNACTWSPNGQLFVSCDKTKKLTIWG